MFPWLFNNVLNIIEKQGKQYVNLLEEKNKKLKISYFKKCSYNFNVKRYQNGCWVAAL